MSFKIPEIGFGGKPVKGALERLFEKPVKQTSPPVAASRARPDPIDIDNPENWIVLEGRDHSGYKYDDLVVCIHRLGYSPAVENAVQGLGWNLQNTGTEKDGTQYIGNIEWEKALALNSLLGNMTLTPRQGLDLMLDIRAATGKKHTKKLYNAKGNEIDEERLKIFYDEIWKKREPWRGEWLDAKFNTAGGAIQTVKYGHHLGPDGKLLVASLEPIGPYMTESGFMNINKASKRGLGTEGAKNEILYFYPPTDGSVARFSADSGRAGLGCNGDPRGSDSALGVRAVRAKK